jgi:uncharacterized membrane protein
MMKLKSRLIGYLESLRFPWLLLLTAVLFLFSVLVPDAFPFVDEIVLALIAAVLARIKKRRPENRDQGGDQGGQSKVPE